MRLRCIEHNPFWLTVLLSVAVMGLALCAPSAQAIDFAIRLGQGGFRDHRAEDGILGGGQLCLDMRLGKSPVLVTISQEYYKKSPYAVHPYEIAGLILASLSCTVPMTENWKWETDFGGGIGGLEVPRGEAHPGTMERAFVFDLVGRTNVKIFWKIGAYIEVKYLYSRKTKQGTRVIDVSDFPVLLGISCNSSW